MFAWAVFVQDVDAAKTFYVDVLGTEVVFGDEESWLGDRLGASRVLSRGRDRW